ncbi:hypothetical protein H4Q26_006978 [Puccinia striiformis f. sp. tritici PST-130]|nr:hypothetical protein H4Q26_006978 [Puccinia striiformis f. sp. tritici PST-130]
MVSSSCVPPPPPSVKQIKPNSHDSLPPTGGTMGEVDAVCLGNTANALVETGLTSLAQEDCEGEKRVTRGAEKGFLKGSQGTQRGLEISQRDSKWQKEENQ